MKKLIQAAPRVNMLQLKCHVNIASRKLQIIVETIHVHTTQLSSMLDRLNIGHVDQFKAPVTRHALFSPFIKNSI
jgi:hypothetical protein